MSRCLFWLPISLMITFLPGAAKASEIFPSTVATALGLSAAPPCTICHTTDPGQKGTANQPLGKKLQASGLTAGDTQTLTTLLGKMRDAGDDTDHDGVSDIDELKAGRNPNINDITGQLPEDYPPPVYGCQASRTQARAPGIYGACALAAAWLVVALWFRRPRPLVGMIALVCASLAGCQNAPLDVVDGVDLGRFQGQWYEIARLPRATQIDCAGTTASYRLTSARELVVTNECAVGGLNGIRRQITASAKVISAAVPAKLSVDFGGFYGDYWIIDLDRDGYTYAVVGHPTRQYLWILSRAPAMDATTLAAIIERANQKGFDTSRLEYTKQLP
jgi:apolipoprotein D and lipocalin family protein